MPASRFEATRPATARASPSSTSRARSTPAPRRRSTAPTPRPPATGPATILLNFRDVDYINITGIALIVGLLAQARKDAASTCRPAG